jgi:hypothetical protein
MTEESPTVREQLEGAARDLWTMPVETGDEHIVFIDRRHMNARVERCQDGRFGITWQTDDGAWIAYDRTFENPREAAFHAYQGPH